MIRLLFVIVALTFNIYSLEDVSFLGTSIFVTEFEYELPPNEKNLYLNQDNQFQVKGDKAVVILRPVKKGSGKVFQETFKKGFFPVYKASQSGWLWWDNFKGVWEGGNGIHRSGKSIRHLVKNANKSAKKTIKFENYLYTKNEIKKFYIKKIGPKKYELDDVGKKYFRFGKGVTSFYPSITLNSNFKDDVYLVYPIDKPFNQKIYSSKLPNQFAPYFFINKEKTVELSTDKKIIKGPLRYEKKLVHELDNDLRIINGPKNRWFTQKLKLVKGAYSIRNYHSLFSSVPMKKTPKYIVPPEPQVIEIPYLSNNELRYLKMKVKWLINPERPR